MIQFLSVMSAETFSGLVVFLLEPIPNKNLKKFTFLIINTKGNIITKETEVIIRNFTKIERSKGII